MTKIESVKAPIQASSEQVFNFLSNFNNFEKLMPAQVSNWSSDEIQCSFTINGMATIGMKIIEKKPFSFLKITANGKVPFEFTLLVHIQSVTTTSCTGQLVFEADLNPMLKMMLEKPLTNFFNILAEKMGEIIPPIS